MKRRWARCHKNINKPKAKRRFTIEEILEADLSHNGALFMLFILILLVGSIFMEEEVLWIMALVAFVELINKSK